MTEVQISSYDDRDDDDENSCFVGCRELFDSYKYEGAVIILTLCDMVFIILELIVNSKWFEEYPASQTLANVLHVFIIIVLVLFLLESFVKMWLYRLKLFCKWADLAEVLVVTAAAITELVYYHSFAGKSGFEAIVIVRLWRILRLIAGIRREVESKATLKVKQHRKMRENAEKECVAAQEECDLLRHQKETLIKVIMEVTDKTESEILMLLRDGSVPVGWTVN
ncbi:unnamed protein product [Notodromas monacha]|uniref:Voltage-gated hydrogen channel 1 n=1 Tax=Notodromas monacha TaxID=399045 RepID=A0A7R9GGU5_9CRUS|nr:unnamed protein product [Notodromas monacha]CAG0922218.1 unnamed protein product [Notodromas monacha]